MVTMKELMKVSTKGGVSELLAASMVWMRVAMTAALWVYQ